MTAVPTNKHKNPSRNNKKLPFSANWHDKANKYDTHCLTVIQWDYFLQCLDHKILNIYSASTGFYVCVLITQYCLTLCDPMNCSPPESSVHGILQARILEWVAIPFSRGSSRPRDLTQVCCTAGRFFTIWATEAMLNQKAAFHFEVSSTEEYAPCMWSASLGLDTSRLCIAYVSDCYPLRSIK